MDLYDDLALWQEEYDLEFKAAQGKNGKGELPKKTLWETYSAMANTNGGKVVLGVEEKGEGVFNVVGLQEPHRLIDEFWSKINNSEVVNKNILKNEDVSVCQIDNKNILVINIPRADRVSRPIYWGKNPYTGTFRRDGTGDFRCKESDVNRMLAEAMDEPRDSQILTGFDMSDIDQESLIIYRNLFRVTKPSHPWLEVDDIELLRNLGGWKKDRETGKEGLTIAGLLMFGKHHSIHEAIPNYMVDYQEKESDNSETRWIDRVVTDGTWSGNLFGFYTKVLRKLYSNLKVPFRLEESSQRIDETHVHVALREAFVNVLIHADYSTSLGILVEKYPDKFIFRNPGGLRIPLEDVFQGGKSDCRNRNLLQMFQHIGACEKAGSGFPKILMAWRGKDWKKPILREEIVPECTTLELSMLSLVSPETTEQLTDRFGEDYLNFAETERLALATALNEGSVTHGRLKDITDDHPKDITLMFGKLTKKGGLVAQGQGRGTVYHLADENNSIEGHELPDTLIQTLMELSKPIRSQSRAPSEEIENMILKLCQNDFLPTSIIKDCLGRNESTVRSHYLSKMVKQGLLELRFPEVSSHRNQAYRTLSKQSSLFDIDH